MRVGSLFPEHSYRFDSCCSYSRQQQSERSDNQDQGGDAAIETVVRRLRVAVGVKSLGEIDGLLDLGAIRNLGLRAIDGRAHETAKDKLVLCF